MINVSTEKLLTLDQAAELLQVSKATVTAWIKRGTHGIRLEAIKFGAHWRTSEEAIQRFGDRQTPNVHLDFSHILPKRTSKSAERAHERAMKELEYEFGERKCATCKKEIDVGRVTIPRDAKLYCPACIVQRKSAKLGQRIQVFRWARQMSQQALNDRTGISVDFVRAYESNQKMPSADHLGKLINFFGLELVANLEPPPELKHIEAGA